MAAKKLRMNHVPVIYQEFESDEQLYAHLVADNAIGKDTWATLDLTKINVELENMIDLNIDMLGLKEFDIETEKEHEDKEVELSFDYKIEINCNDEMTQQSIMSEMKDRGLQVRVLL